MSAGTGAELETWNAILAAALALPGARVDRGAFLRSKLRGPCSAEDVERAMRSRPASAHVDAKVLRRAAEGSIQKHRLGVTATSLAIGLPGGLLAAGAIPADLAQYFWHAVVVLQEVAYLYGWPNLFQEAGDIDDETKLVLTLFLGVMWDAEGARNAVDKLSSSVSSASAARLPQGALTKADLRPTAEAIATWIAVKLAKKQLTELLGRVVPLVGGVVGGSMTWLGFGKSSKRLLEQLEGMSLAMP